MMNRLAVCCLCLVWATSVWSDDKLVTLPGTDPLTLEGDIAAQLVDGVDKFLLRKINESVGKRELSGRDFDFQKVEASRKRLAKILGIRDSSIQITAPEGDISKLDFNARKLLETLRARDERVEFTAPEILDTAAQSGLIAENERLQVYAVKWPVVRDVWSEGLLLVPKGKVVAHVVAISDADQTPEQFAGLMPGVPEDLQFAKQLAENGCRVLVPALINRKLEKRYGRAVLSNREYLYRSAFELGRHLIGYEVQKVLAGVDWFAREAAGNEVVIGVFGYGEGGALALYSAALDDRIDGAYVAGYFGPRERVWEQPIDRNVFGLLNEFGDAELARMVGARRRLVIDARPGPTVDLPGNGGGAPATLSGPARQDVDKEIARVASFADGVRGSDKYGVVDFLFDLASVRDAEAAQPTALKPIEVDTDARQQRLIHQIDDHNQWLLAESPYIRAEFMKKLDTSSVEAYRKSVEPYREYFAKEVIGQFDDPLLEPKPRTRKSYDTEKWTGYEVVLDVWPDVIAYGILCVPKDLDLAGKEQRPVVVCQHGLEGRPQDVIGEQNAQYYSGFAGKLAEQGFITFAPQNLYIGRDRFRTLQRKANPLGKTLFSIIVPQHQQIVNWLSSLPYVDKDRIAFYGLSYGGKSAMRIPPLVPQYCLSICSADFNDWVDKNASTRAPYSYVWTNEYEIFEFDLGSTFNYAEMAALICPRPFMVERGHFDGVGVDERVASEYAKVQHLYAARLKIPDQCQIEFFDGPHKINGVGTYEFLHKHLKWPKR
jgi:dienelactone hydrolase